MSFKFRLGYQVSPARFFLIQLAATNIVGDCHTDASKGLASLLPEAEPRTLDVDGHDGQRVLLRQCPQRRQTVALPANFMLYTYNCRSRMMAPVMS